MDLGAEFDINAQLQNDLKSEIANEISAKPQNGSIINKKSKISPKPDKIIGCIYLCNVLNGRIIPDLPIFMLNFVTNCGLITDLSIDLPNLPFLFNMTHFRAIVLSFIKNSEVYKISGEIAGILKLVTNINKELLKTDYPLTNQQKNELLVQIFKVIDDLVVGKDISEEFAIGLKNDIGRIGNKDNKEIFNSDDDIVHQICNGIYGLIKFIIEVNDEENIIEFIKKILAHTTVHWQPFAGCFIGSLVGYNHLFSVYPYFDGRDYINNCNKLFLRYLYGLSTRVKLGEIMIETNKGQRFTGIRYMHMTDCPSPEDMFATKNLPENLSALSKLRRVSYIECHGLKFTTGANFAKHFLGNVSNDLITQLTNIDLNHINAGIKAKLATEVENEPNSFL